MLVMSYDSIHSLAFEDTTDDTIIREEAIDNVNIDRTFVNDEKEKIDDIDIKEAVTDSAWADHAESVISCLYQVVFECSQKKIS